MANPIVHFEISGQNLDKLKTFYTNVFGWHSENFEMPTGNYIMFDTHAGGINGGLTAAPAGMQPMATCYIDVPDLEATLKKVEEAGGKTVVPITDVGMVVFAMFTDPQGHFVGIAKSDPNQPQPEHKEPTEGAIVWFEVVGPEGKQLREFYHEVFGWQTETTEGDYAMVDPQGGVGIGAGIGAPHPGVPSYTSVYIQTRDLAAKLQQIEAAGGKTVVPPQDMGTVQFAMFTDPEGCLMGIVKGG